MDKVFIDGVDLYETYNCILAKKNVGVALPQTQLVEVPLRDGSIDLSEYLTQDVKYKNRTVKFTLLYLGTEPAEALTSIMNFLNGKRMRITFSDEIDCYYLGRLKVKKHTYKTHGISIEIEADCGPFKYDIDASDVDWEWDTFNFDSGIINEAGAIVVNGSAEFVLIMRQKRAFPIFTVTGNVTLEYDDKQYVLKTGEQKIYNLFLSEGENPIKFTGNGTVAIKYVGGRL